MATFKATAKRQLKQQLRNVLSAFLLWWTFHLADGICESGSSLRTFSQLVGLACGAATTVLKFYGGMSFIAVEALLRIGSVAAYWKRAALSGMLILGIVGLSGAYLYLAVPVFQEWYRYLTICDPNVVGYPSLIAMELTVSMAFVPMYAWVAVSKNHHWIQ